MTVLTSTSRDLKNLTLQKCGELTDGTSDYDTDGDGRALLFLNKAYLAVLAGSNEFNLDIGEPWTWALSQQPGKLTLLPKVTGTATATLDSTAVTFSVAPAISLAGYFIQFDNNPEWYYISSHVITTTAAVLDAAYNSTTGSLSYTAVKTDYDLSPNSNGILRLVAPMKVYQAQDYQGDSEYKIYSMDKPVLERDYPKTRLEEGTPTFFSVIFHDPQTNVITVRFNKVAAVQTRVEYDFIAMPDILEDAAASVPLIPIVHRDVLAYCATYMLMLDKSDERSQAFLALAQAKLKALIGGENRQKTQTSKNRGRLIPRQDDYWRTKRYVVQEAT